MARIESNSGDHRGLRCILSKTQVNRVVFSVAGTPMSFRLNILFVSLVFEKYFDYPAICH